MNRISIAAMLLVGFILAEGCGKKQHAFSPVDYVDPFIGTGGHGHTFPGATLPYGMVQLSPQTRLKGWDGCSGYHYSDSAIYGFAHTALNGTGASDYGDILVMPVVGKATLSNDDYKSEFRKETEKARAGYYSVFLDKPGVQAEMTATTRVGYHRYTFPESAESKILIDLQHRDQVLDSWIEVVSDTEVRGYRRSAHWAKDQQLYFYMRFSKPFNSIVLAKEDQFLVDKTIARGTNIKVYFGFNTQDREEIEIKVALSAVDAEGAKQNLDEELPDWDFEAARHSAYATWNEKLKVIEVKGGTHEQLATFYSALYHVFLQPNIFMDVDRRYRGMDGNVHLAGDFDNYTVFSLWDTYRTWHPLITILDPDLANNFVKVFLDMYKKGGLLPVWELAANETFCMIGYHSVSVIADAWAKGIRNFDAKIALEAMLQSANKDHFGLADYRKFGYIPSDKEHESVSKTLEYAYDDWCIAQFAKDLGRQDVYADFIRRAQSYKNLFDPSTGFMRAKINGSFTSPFDPTTVDWNFTEANSWQYSFYVPQDITGLTELHGGKEELARKLDSLFDTRTTITGRDMKDISGLIGMYAHGNEPSHHMAYLYNFVNQPWKTQQRVRQIMDELYSHRTDGFPGNEDCGQMSSWLVMSAMGFYPVTPGLAQYTIGTPWFRELVIHLPGKKTFTVVGKKVSKRNIYIRSAKLDGKDYPYSYLNHQTIINGGRLVFNMTSKPNKHWGSANEHVPVAWISEDKIVPVPYVDAPSTRFSDSVVVELKTLSFDDVVHYTLDGSIPDNTSRFYTYPLVLKESTQIKCLALNQLYGSSMVTTANFIKIADDVKISAPQNPHPNYTAGGIEALIDGKRGGQNWRIGNWVGFQGTDVEAVIDLGKIRPIRKLTVGLIQDTGSWIYFPTRVEFFESDDGITYRKLSEIHNTYDQQGYQTSQHDFMTSANTRTRFVKIVAYNYGKLPAWHSGAGGDAYIFMDEIIID